MPDMTSSRGPAKAIGINHLVLNVRDIEAAHEFYASKLGFEQCGHIVRPGAKMRFYRSSADHHHDLALVEMPAPADAPEVSQWALQGGTGAVNHFAVCYPDAESWKQQLEYMQEQGVEFAIRGNHGMTRSAYVVDPDGNGVEILYEVARELWEGDINAALNYFEVLPTSGPESLDDSAEYARFG